MTDNLNVNNNPNDCDKTIQECRHDHAGGTVPLFEEMVVTKTEITEEAQHFEMPINNLEPVNVKDEYVYSPEIIFEEEHSEFTNNSECLLNKNLEVENCGTGQLHLMDLRQEDLVGKIISKYVIVDRTDIRAPIRKDLLAHSRNYVVDKPFKCTYIYCKCKPGQKEFCKCNACTFASTNEYKLTNHMLARHNIQKYKCKDCDYATPWRKSLVRHMSRHIGDKPFKCTYKDCKCILGQAKRCKCKTCKFATAFKHNLTSHILEKHNTKSKNDDEKPNNFKCKDCGYTTHKTPYIMVHIDDHSGEKPFKRIYKLCESTPGEEEAYKCKNCGHSITSNANLGKNAGKA